MNLVKKLALSASMVLAIAFTFGCSDDKDESYAGRGNDIANYKTVTIGTQTWMAENLDYVVLGSKCYEDKPANCEKYGSLYDWNVAKTVCSAGWHLPTAADWDILLNYVQTENGGGEYIPGHLETYFFGGSADIAGKYLKTASGWNDNGNGEDKYDFAALPAGSIYNGNSINVGTAGFWWATKDVSIGSTSYGTAVRMDYNSEIAEWLNAFKTDYLISVRCVKD